MWKLWGAALFWGLNWPAVKIMLGSSSPWTLRAAGLAGGAAVMLIVALIRRDRLAIQRSHWHRVAVAGLLNVTGFNICSVFAQMNLPTTRATVLTFTMPFWATLFGWCVLGEKVDARRALALSLGAAGLLVMSQPFWAVVRAGDLPVGLLFALGAAISWAAGTVWLRRFPVDASPVVSTFWQVLIAAVICMFGMLAFETPHLDLSSLPVAFAFGYHILLPQAAAYVLWFALVREVPAATAALGTLLIPLFGVAGAIVLLGDWPGTADVVGLSLILSAVVVDQILTRRNPSPA